MLHRSMTPTSPVESLSDHELLAETAGAAADERRTTARLVVLLCEVDTRRLYLGQGCSSLFTYCTQVLHLSEHAAYGRIEAARAARRFPLVVERLVSGELTLTGVGLLRSHLTTENHRELLDAARHRSKRDIEELVARLVPRPPVPSSVRKLPAPTASSAASPSNTTSALPLLAAPSPRAESPQVAIPPPATSAVVQPLAPERYKVQLTISADTRKKLSQLQDLLRHQVPDGDLAEIFDRAITVLLAQVQRRKLAVTERSRDDARRVVPGSRHVPASVRRAVWARDGGRCAFAGEQGRCTETGFLEFHHKVPFALGGPTTEENLELRCRSHNGYEAAKYFGRHGLPFVRERPVECQWQLGPDRVWRAQPMRWGTAC